MKRASTPTHFFTLPISADLIKTFLLTYKQGGRIILEKRRGDMTINGNVWSVQLTQEEANLFEANVVASAQIRVLTITNEALPSNIMTFRIDPVLNDEVLT